MRKDLPMKVYIITNIINQKQYIGVTSQTLEARFKGHKQTSRDLRVNRKLSRAIRKYGEENFKIELLEDNIMYENITEKEQYYIKKFDTFNNGYNMTVGGDGICGYECGEEWREKMRPVWARIYTPERAKKISWRLKGIKRSEETKQKISAIKKEYYKTYDNPFKNKTHTEESKNQMSITSTKYYIEMIDIKNNDIIKRFNTMMEACKWIKETQKRSAKLTSIRHTISECIRQKRFQWNQVYGYKWRYQQK